MANNRMFLACVKCLGEEETQWDDCVVYVSKYLPSQGWQYGETESAQRMGVRIEEFFIKHDHPSMLGEYITIVYESLTPFGQEKSAILRSIQEALVKVQDGAGT